MRCYVKLLEELLKRRADPNHADRAGETSLFALAHSISWCDQAPRHRRATVQRLVEGAADVNFANPRGKTPLHVAAGHTDAAALEALLAERADVDARDLGGFTALMWAAGRGHGGNVQRLLDARARSDLSANRGQTAMLFALTNHCEEVVKTLEEHAALQDRKAGVLPEWAHRSTVNVGGISGGAPSVAPSPAPSLARCDETKPFMGQVRARFVPDLSSNAYGEKRFEVIVLKVMPYETIGKFKQSLKASYPPSEDEVIRKLSTDEVLDVKIPETCRSIAPRAFQGCKSLVRVSIPNSVTEIRSCAFAACSSLIRLNIPESETSAFAGCGSLSYLEIPRSVTLIESFAFARCSSLSSVRIPNSVTRIENYAFAGCSSLASVRIPSSVTQIGPRAFAGCTRLREVDLPKTLGGCVKHVFEGCSSLPRTPSGSLSPPRSALSDASVPSAGDTSASANASASDSDVSAAQLSIAVQFMSGKVLGVDVVPEITIGELKETLKAWHPSEDELTRTLSAVQIILDGQNLVDDDATVDTVGISPTAQVQVLFTTNPTVECSSKWACEERSAELRDVRIPDTVRLLVPDAFSHCTSLQRVHIPQSVTEIGTNAFASCGSLTRLAIPDSVTWIGDRAFESCISLKTLTIPDSVVQIGSFAFDSCSAMTSLSISKSLTEIAQCAFQGCTSLTSLTIPNSDSVVRIGQHAFAGCTSLRSMSLPDSVTQIGSSKRKAEAFLDGYLLDEEITDSVRQAKAKAEPRPSPSAVEGPNQGYYSELQACEQAILAEFPGVQDPFDAGKARVALSLHGVYRHSYCNLNQTAFEEAWCHYAAQVEAEFEGFAVCFDHRRTNYLQYETEQKAQLVIRQQEWRALVRIRCFTRAFEHAFQKSGRFEEMSKHPGEVEHCHWPLPQIPAAVSPILMGSWQRMMLTVSGKEEARRSLTLPGNLKRPDSARRRNAQSPSLQLQGSASQPGSRRGSAEGDEEEDVRAEMFLKAAEGGNSDTLGLETGDCQVEAAETKRTLLELGVPGQELLGEDHCQWEYVTCEFLGCHVIELYCRHSCQGRLPKELKLKHLMEVDLCKSNVTGDLASFQHTPKLTRLFLDKSRMGGDLKDLEATPLLEALSLAQTRVGGDIAALAKLPAMQSVQLQNTQVEGDVKVFAAFGATSDLMEVNLASTKVHGNLTHFTGAEDLQRLDLSNTQVTGTLGPRTWLVKGEELQVLNLANTSITFEFDAWRRRRTKRTGKRDLRADVMHLLHSFSRSGSLQTIIASDASLSGELLALSGAVPISKSLLTLDLSGNNITRVQQSPVRVSKYVLEAAVASQTVFDLTGTTLSHRQEAAGELFASGLLKSTTEFALRDEQGGFACKNLIAGSL
eukprot:g12094.t1